MNAYPFRLTGLRPHAVSFSHRVEWNNPRKWRPLVGYLVFVAVSFWLMGRGLKHPSGFTLFLVSICAIVLLWGTVQDVRRSISQVTFFEDGFTNRRVGVEITYRLADLSALHVRPPLISFIPQYRLTWTDRRGVEDGVHFWFLSTRKRMAFEAWVSMARQRPEVASVRFV